MVIAPSLVVPPLGGEANPDRPQGADAPAKAGTTNTTLRAAHLVGVCGSGMKALAELLSGMGVRVSGSDLQMSDARAAYFAKRGLVVHQGHEPQHVDRDVDVLIYSPAIGPHNAERRFAAAHGIAECSYSQMLGRLMREKIGVSIAGTHGKSTTTAMVGCVLESAGLSPSVIIGAELRGFPVSGWPGTGPLFVAESCEFRRSFLYLTPTHAAILGIEPDHFDCFETFDETIGAFAEFAKRIPDDGSLLIPHDCPASRKAAARASVPVETFSLGAEADWWGTDLRATADGTRFRAFFRGDFFAEITLRIPGRHNVLNALAAAAVCQRVGADAAAIREGLAGFEGIRRRFEPVGTWRGVTLIDDYAHHPTAVSVTLKAARERFAGRRVWCLFQPHQVSRTLALWDEFVQSLAAADELLLVPVFAAREQAGAEPVDTSRRLADSVRSAGGSVRFCTSLDRAAATLEDSLQPGDVLITMGAGDVGQVQHALTRRLPRDSDA